MKTVAIDTETYLFEPGNMAPKVVCLSWATEDASGVLLPADIPAFLEDHRGWLWVGQNFAYDAMCLMSSFPKMSLWKLIIEQYDKDLVTDTMLRQQLLDIAILGQTRTNRYSLEALAKRHNYPVDLEKITWRTHYDTLDGKPLSEWPQGAINYAEEDARATLHVWNRQELSTDLLSNQFAQTRAALALHSISVWGMHTDPKVLRMVIKRQRKFFEEDVEALLGAGLLVKAMRGRGDAKEWTGEYKAQDKIARQMVVDYCASEKLPVPLTDKGAASLASDTLEALGDPLLARYGRYKKAKSRIDELEKLEQGVYKPIHPRYNVLMETGRTSSGGGDLKINIQNRRREFGFREVFIPRKGFAYITSDFSAIELNSWATVCEHLLGYSNMGEVFRKGQDPHCVTAAILMGIDYEEAVRLKKAGDKELKNYRQLSKALNFGLPGGSAEVAFRSFAKLSYKVDIPPSEYSPFGKPGALLVDWDKTPNSLLDYTLPPNIVEEARRAEEEAQQHQEKEGPSFIHWRVDSDAPGVMRVGKKWLRKAYPQMFVMEGTYGYIYQKFVTLYPELLDYKETIKKLLKRKNNRMESLKTKRFRGRCYFTNAANGFFQGLTADGAKHSMWLVFKESMIGSLRGSRMFLFVHDEIGLETPLDKVDEHAKILADLMVKGMSEYNDVPVTVEYEAMDRWSKAAEAVYDENGKLQVWQCPIEIGEEE